MLKPSIFWQRYAQIFVVIAAFLTGLHLMSCSSIIGGGNISDPNDLNDKDPSPTVTPPPGNGAIEFNVIIPVANLVKNTPANFALQIPDAGLDGHAVDVYYTANPASDGLTLYNSCSAAPGGCTRVQGNLSQGASGFYNFSITFPVAGIFRGVFVVQTATQLFYSTLFAVIVLNSNGGGSNPVLATIPIVPNSTVGAPLALFALTNDSGVSITDLVKTTVVFSVGQNVKINEAFLVQRYDATLGTLVGGLYLADLMRLDSFPEQSSGQTIAQRPLHLGTLLSILPVLVGKTYWAVFRVSPANATYQNLLTQANPANSEDASARAIRDDFELEVVGPQNETYVSRDLFNGGARTKWALLHDGPIAKVYEATGVTLPQSSGHLNHHLGVKLFATMLNRNLATIANVVRFEVGVWNGFAWQGAANEWNQTTKDMMGASDNIWAKEINVRFPSQDVAITYQLPDVGRNQASDIGPRSIKLFYGPNGENLQFPYLDYLVRHISVGPISTQAALAQRNNQLFFGLLQPAKNSSLVEINSSHNILTAGLIFDWPVSIIDRPGKSRSQIDAWLGQQLNKASVGGSDYNSIILDCGTKLINKYYANGNTTGGGALANFPVNLAATIRGESLNGLRLLFQEFYELLDRGLSTYINANPNDPRFGYPFSPGYGLRISGGLKYQPNASSSQYPRGLVVDIDPLPNQAHWKFNRDMFQTHASVNYAAHKSAAKLNVDGSNNTCEDYLSITNTNSSLPEENNQPNGKELKPENWNHAARRQVALGAHLLSMSHSATYYFKALGSIALQMRSHVPIEPPVNGSQPHGRPADSTQLVYNWNVVDSGAGNQHKGQAYSGGGRGQAWSEYFRVLAMGLYDHESDVDFAQTNLDRELYTMELAMIPGWDVSIIGAPYPKNEFKLMTTNPAQMPQGCTNVDTSQPPDGIPEYTGCLPWNLQTWEQALHGYGLLGMRYWFGNAPDISGGANTTAFLRADSLAKSAARFHVELAWNAGAGIPSKFKAMSGQNHWYGAPFITQWPLPSPTDRIFLSGNTAWEIHTTNYADGFYFMDLATWYFTQTNNVSQFYKVMNKYPCPGDNNYASCHGFGGIFTTYAFENGMIY